MSSNQARRSRLGDLMLGSTGVEAHLVSNIATFTVSASALGLTKIEGLVTAEVTAQTVAGGNPVGVVAQLGGTSTVIGMSVVQNTGTTVQLQVSAMGTI